jgi:ribosomal protein S18 acetylase RimI-like enzyme
MHQIRFARPSDRPRLLRLVKQYYRFDSIDFDERITGRALQRLLNDKSLGRAWVLDSERRLVGYAVLTYNYDLEFGGIEGIVTELYVVPRYRSRGLGAQLIDEIRRFCRNKGISAIELQVGRDNRRARAFYRKIGFRALDRIVMSLEIKGEDTRLV